MKCPDQKQHIGLGGKFIQFRRKALRSLSETLALGRVLLVPAAVVVIVASTTACSDDPQESGDRSAVKVVQPGAPGESSREFSEEEANDQLDAPGYKMADVRFMQGMIPHHGQALRMTSLVEDRTGSRDITLLARRIELSQEVEIRQMEKWLSTRGETVPSANSAHQHHAMTKDDLAPGMLTEKQFSRLAASSGDEFNRLFLDLMIQHHNGALAMVGHLRESNGGLEPESFTISASVEADQQIEIKRMTGMLAEFGSASN
jgi:uncharacterized protein (DUF305 family)